MWTLFIGRGALGLIISRGLPISAPVTVRVTLWWVARQKISPQAKRSKAEVADEGNQALFIKGAI